MGAARIDEGHGGFVLEAEDAAPRAGVKMGARRGSAPGATTAGPSICTGPAVMEKTLMVGVETMARRRR